MVLSVCSLKGGVGKTSVVLGLASAALTRGVDTLVVDLDPQADATLAMEGPEDGAADVSDVLANPRRSVVRSAISPSGWAAEGGVLDMMAGSAATSTVDRPGVSERGLGRLSDALQHVEGYKLVLIDCPPSLGNLTRSGLLASHRAIIVTEPALFAVAAADRALRAVDDLRRGPATQLQPMGVLVNRYRDRSPEHRYRVTELNEMFGPLVLSPMIPERSALQQAQGASQPVHRWPGNAGRELSAAFDSHLNRVLRLASRRGAHRRAGAAI
jgi:cellulose biosynthesis protein BcsQ